MLLGFVYFIRTFWVVADHNVNFPYFVVFFFGDSFWGMNSNSLPTLIPNEFLIVV